MEEVWKQYDSKYEVSNLGNVRHIKYKRILKYNYPTNGTPQVKLSHKSVCISHLVAGLFFGKRPEGHDIHHKDHNPSNNNVNNLEYKKAKEHKLDHKRMRRRLKLLAAQAAHNSTTPAGQSVAQNSLGIASSTVDLPSITTSQAGELRSASNLIAV